MPSAAVTAMESRARAVRARAAVQHWQYRQRNLAAGVWFRLRRVLSDAREAYAISEDDARRLIAEGHNPEACGLEVSPSKTILFVDEQRVAALESRRAIPVSLGAPFLAARAIALVAF